MPRLTALLGYGVNPEGTGSLGANLVSGTATVTPDAAVAGRWFVPIATTSGIAVAFPLNPGPDISFIFQNASGAASMTPPVFASPGGSANYLLASNGVFPPPTVAGKRRTIGFTYDGANYVEAFRSLSDI